jgi:hypothetical protein
MRPGRRRRWAVVLLLAAGTGTLAAIAPVPGRQIPG